MRIRVHNKKTGATSILVIVLMVILIVLGLAILTTAQSGVRLAQKKELWLQSYYSLEGQMAQVQATFMEAWKAAMVSASPGTEKNPAPRAWSKPIPNVPGVASILPGGSSSEG